MHGDCDTQKLEDLTSSIKFATVNTRRTVPQVRLRIYTMITLKTLKSASRQAVFDQVSTHLLTQNKQAVSARAASGACRYRGPKGLKCAVGCLIADDEYKRSFEGMSWAGLASEHKVPDAHIPLLSALQSVHDDLSPPEWREGLRTVAEKFKLETKVLEA